MKISDKNIDDLFKRLEEHVIQPDISNVEEMKIKLEGMKYQQFGWRHFNIYYTGLIVLSMLCSIWAVTDGIMERANENQQISSDTVFIRDTVYLNTVGIKKNTEETNKTINEINFTKKDKPVSSLHTIKAKLKNEKDSSLPQPAPITTHGKDPVLTTNLTPNPDSLKPIKSYKPKKIIYINKKDTIIKYDTTKVFKKK